MLTSSQYPVSVRLSCCSGWQLTINRHTQRCAFVFNETKESTAHMTSLTFSSSVLLVFHVLTFMVSNFCSQIIVSYNKTSWKFGFSSVFSNINPANERSCCCYCTYRLICSRFDYIWSSRKLFWTCGKAVQIIIANTYKINSKFTSPSSVLFNKEILFAVRWVEIHFGAKNYIRTAHAQRIYVFT